MRVDKHTLLAMLMCVIFALIIGAGLGLTLYLALSGAQ